MKTKGDPRKELVSRPWRQPKNLNELLVEGPSKHGWHNTMSHMYCLECMRLAKRDCRKLDYDGLTNMGRLDALAFGILWHLLLEAAMRRKDPIKVLGKIRGIPQEDHERLELMWALYEEQYGTPLWAGKMLGAEAQLRVNIPGTRRPFTCRLDLVLLVNGRVVIVEYKTTSRFGATSVLQWRTAGQTISQTWAWNRHPISKKYGKVYEHRFDFAVKTKNPEFHREPVHVTKHQLKQMGDDLKKNQKLLDYCVEVYGWDHPWPRSYDCQRRYGSCDYLDLCHNQHERLYVHL